MIEIINTDVYGLRESIIRSKYPKTLGREQILNDSSFVMAKDIKRVRSLSSTDPGTGHNNFLKGIIVQFDIRYPEYFSPQLQRYHWIDIISSQSKMHMLMSRRIEQTDFVDPIPQDHLDRLNLFIQMNMFTKVLNELPESYMKWMGVSTNYLQLKTIYLQRRHHKLVEWQQFCDWIEGLPMQELITGNYEEEV
jgi:hypothetical protein